MITAENVAAAIGEANELVALLLTMVRSGMATSDLSPAAQDKLHEFGVEPEAFALLMAGVMAGAIEDPEQAPHAVWITCGAVSGFFVGVKAAS